MNKEPLISIIIPVYNTEKYLEHCLDSVINQTYKNLEIILIDDGSNDNSGLICEDYKKKDNRISVLHKQNEGVSKTRNIGLKIFKGEYVSFVDSDDYISNNFVKHMYNLINKYNADFSVCSYCHIYNGIVSKKVIFNDCVFSDDAVFHHNTFQNYMGYKLFKRSLVLNSRFKDDIGLSEDSIFVRELLLKTHKIVFTSKIYYFYVMNPNSISHSRDFYLYELREIVNYLYQYLLELSFHRKTNINIISENLSQYYFWFKKLINHRYIHFCNFERDLLKEYSYALRICKRYKDSFIVKIRYSKLYLFLKPLWRLLRFCYTKISRI